MYAFVFLLLISTSPTALHAVFYVNDAYCMTLTVLFIERNLFYLIHILVAVLYKELVSLQDHIKFTNCNIFSFDGFIVHVIVPIVHTVMK